MLYQFLYSEVFFSFKDFNKKKQLINIEVLNPSSDGQQKQLVSQTADQGGKIIKELLNELFQRYIKFLGEPRIAAHQDCTEMQDVFAKIHDLLKEDCLKIDRTGDET